MLGMLTLCRLGPCCRIEGKINKSIVMSNLRRSSRIIVVGAAVLAHFEHSDGSRSRLWLFRALVQLLVVHVIWGFLVSVVWFASVWWCCGQQQDNRFIIRPRPSRKLLHAASWEESSINLWPPSKGSLRRYQGVGQFILFKRLRSGSELCASFFFIFFRFFFPIFFPD